MQLTPAKKKVLDFVTSYTNRKGVSPSQQEIGRGLKLSVSTINQHLKELEEAGQIKRESKRHRSIELSMHETIVNIPILGSIKAGYPLPAIEERDGSVPVINPQIKSSEGYYALRVVGDSMIDDGIFDGDIVIIKNQPVAEDGQTVVAIIDDNEATLKKIYRKGKGFNLEPRNPEMPTLFRTDVEIRGVVVQVIRNLEKGTRDNTLTYKKKAFLDQIRSKNPNSQNKYKRVALSTIRYAGGKSLAVGHVIELLPDNITKVVSPFFGGGSIEIAMSKELGLEVVGYDVFDILCNYWKFQIEKSDLLHEKLKKLKPNKKTFEKIRLILNDVWKKKVKLDPLTLAVYYVYNFNLSYGPGFMGWSSDIYLDDKKYKRMLENIKNFDPKNLKVECADFRDAIKKHSNDFLYCDPPYYIGKDSKMFKGVYPMRNIPVHHNGFPHEELRDLLKNHKGGFILSYNNCPTIREYYKEFQHSFPSWQYTMGQGETRIGLNRKNGNANHVKESHEIIIYSPPSN